MKKKDERYIMIWIFIYGIFFGLSILSLFNYYTKKDTTTEIIKDNEEIGFFKWDLNEIPETGISESNSVICINPSNESLIIQIKR